ncbi:type II toxin-antitoxin system RelE/ParE family toxin [Aliidiomarina celeris]|uniref:type II toxin-antitoxin system RelE/ParE family toxin n=1 Tax=Aliidiomarina celeris TaxID=2249428 RepID=UPI000DEAD7AA|nr:type II toxin-antitoxin system RelE/ParE family toxin [Aliidiomarina celeris]
MWEIRTTDTFDAWFDALDDTDRENVIAAMMVLEQKGPMLSRPYADTVNSSAHKNMKELRVQSKGSPIRAFFAFDPNRAAILLCAGEKTGKEKRFYEEMIPVADKEFSAHLDALHKR